MTIELRFLGAAVVREDDGALVTELDKKELSLLAYLAVEMGYVLRDKIADLLWGEQTDSEAKQNLRQAIYHVNRVLPGAIVAHGRQYLALDAAVHQRSDIGQFEAGLAQRDFKRAIVFYRGPLLDGLSLRREERFEEWLSNRREKYERLMAAALRHLITEAGEQGDDQALEQFARQLVAIDPYDEPAYRHLMLALARQRQLSAAILVFRRCVATLRRDLDIAPSVETAAVYERILLTRDTR